MAQHVYLAGPDVFYPNAAEHAEHGRQLAQRYGFVALTPMDNQLPSLPDGPSMAAWIFAKNIELIQRADFVIANLSPFRGPSADAGTIWEVGYARGRELPVWGYSSDASEYRARVVDDGLAIEDFGGYDNLMITESVKQPLHSSLEQAFEAAAHYFQR
ncbi:nucleoside 2-deoxyribosyltransferase [Carnimonas bestiolae]|uniref:nucleoside 2-deoxyribosyltransferase n=1 Tax=Carnimonas bestiolae TaxID=3402172 RepID=UPI003EDC8402